MKPGPLKTKKRSGVGDEHTGEIDAAIHKRQKVNDEIPAAVQKPKSKKELRLERKAALKAKDPADALETARVIESGGEKGHGRSKKEEKERALEARFREQDRLRRDRQESQIQAKKQGKTKVNEKKDGATKKRADPDPKASDDYAVYKSLFKGSKDPATGATTCRLGVKYVDVKVGTGSTVQSKSLVTVKYQLRGGSPDGVLIDSSKKFTFRLGKGEVIQGWEIGLEGMKLGGVRRLIVPPKAGYGAKDIGAGPGALLHFVVTLLEIR